MRENLHNDLNLDEVDLPPMLALEGDEEVKLGPSRTVPKRVKLNP